MHNSTGIMVLLKIEIEMLNWNIIQG